MKLSQLLATRPALLRQAHLANLACAYVTLKTLADRVAAAQLRGLVRLRPADVAEELYLATLTALEGNQSVIEEHFNDEELMDFADAAAFAIEGEFSQITFRLEGMTERFVLPLRAMLDHAGVTIDAEPQSSPAHRFT